MQENYLGAASHLEIWRLGESTSHAVAGDGMAAAVILAEGLTHCTVDGKNALTVLSSSAAGKGGIQIACVSALL